MDRKAADFVVAAIEDFVAALIRLEKEPCCENAEALSEARDSLRYQLENAD